MSTDAWLEVRVLVPGSMQEEAALYLTEFSGRGVILEDDPAAGGAVIRAFFRPEDLGEWQHQELHQYLARLRGHGLSPLGLEVRRAAEEDWAEAWKEHFKPAHVSARLVIRPPWGEYEAGAGEVVVTIYPGMAFGTGRHPTTVLCLRVLEELLAEAAPARPGAFQVLDVGTGTGILALAAARLGAKVLAIDVDPEAVAAALENVRLNALEHSILVETTPLHQIREQFPLILANLTLHDLTALAESLTGRLASGGRLVVSGFLEEDLPRLLARFFSLGLAQAGYETAENWGVLVLRRV